MTRPAAAQLVVGASVVVAALRAPLATLDGRLGRAPRVACTFLTGPWGPRRPTRARVRVAWRDGEGRSPVRAP